jgi:hypothetical protein
VPQTGPKNLLPLWRIAFYYLVSGERGVSHAGPQE